MLARAAAAPVRESANRPAEQPATTTAAAAAAVAVAVRRIGWDQRDTAVVRSARSDSGLHRTTANGAVPSSRRGETGAQFSQTVIAVTAGLRLVTHSRRDAR